MDVGAKDDIWVFVRRLASAGAAIVLATTDIREVLALANRVVVIRHGRIVREVNPNDTSEHEVLMMSSAEERV